MTLPSFRAGSISENPYLPVPPDPYARLRVFCFHHAGGSASSFARWQPFFGPTVSVAPVQLPGRERRAREPRVRDVDTLVDILVGVLGPALQQPFVFYGHSMGAALAYRITVRLGELGLPLPRLLAVGAYPPPHRPVPLAATAAMPDDELAQLLVDIGGMSDHLLSYPKWRSAATSLVRDDLALCPAGAEGQPVLSCPVHAFAGAEDPILPAAEMADWRDYTTADFRLSTLPGGHFFPTQSQTEFLALFAAVLAGTA